MNQLQRTDTRVLKEKPPVVQTCQVCGDGGDVRQCNSCQEWTCSTCATFAYDSVTCCICRSVVKIHPM